jgi:type II secretory pathway component PulF
MDAPTNPDARKILRIADVVAVGFNVLGLAVLGLQARSLPVFERMFEDFGGTLPGPTQLLLDLKLPIVAFFVCLALATAGVVLRVKGRMSGLVLLVASAALSGLSLTLFLVAMYLPMYGFAGTIK